MTESLESGPEPITFRPIGIIRTPFTDTDGMPVQPVGATGVAGSIELDPAYAEALVDLDGFSHLTLLFHLHGISEARLTVTPFMDDRPHGLFATRSPARPNPIGLSTVRLVGIEGTTLRIEDVDMLDGTPLLDIKPYVPQLDDRPNARIGWYLGRVDHVAELRSDNRYG
jgi:tRNA-Thr(GGU) m(6)t(6)A37 methyltransferase TsaA